MEYGKKIIVKDPSPSYLANPTTIWSSFPTRHQHGHLSLEVDKFSVEY